eukprot:COSAG01_NODE_11393_length_1945_cov_116.280333_2_plen_211_part_00
MNGTAQVPSMAAAAVIIGQLGGPSKPTLTQVEALSKRIDTLKARDWGSPDGAGLERHLVPIIRPRTYYWQVEEGGTGKEDTGPIIGMRQLLSIQAVIHKHEDRIHAVCGRVPAELATEIMDVRNLVAQHKHGGNTAPHDPPIRAIFFDRSEEKFITWITETPELFGDINASGRFRLTAAAIRYVTEHLGCLVVRAYGVVWPVGFTSLPSL